MVGAMGLSHSAQAVGNRLQRGGPVGLGPALGTAQHRARQPLGRIQRLVGKAVFVGEPTFVDRFVLERQDAHHAVALHLEHEVAAQPAVRADRLAPRQFPGARAVAERFGGEGSDRAQIDHVAGQFGIDGLADEREDLGVLATTGHAELHHAGDLLTESHAARAMDAARHVGGDERAEILVRHDPLQFLEARRRGPVADREILQLALAALVADRAIERVVDEQELHHALLRLHRLVGVREYLHAFGDRRGARRQRLGRLLDLHQAHAAVGRDRQLAVPAKMRHVDTERIGGDHDHAAFGHGNRPPVDLEIDQLAFAHVSVRRVGPSESEGPRPQGFPRNGAPPPEGEGAAQRSLGVGVFKPRPPGNRPCIAGGRCGTGTRRGSA